jgi:ornithine carbamoyltransferase
MSSTTTNTTIPNDLLRIGDLDASQLDGLLDLASQMKREPLKWRTAHRGEVLACYFAKPSTRTRVSFEAAACRLGLLPVMLRPDELQLGRGEPISDTARVLSAYAAGIVIRTFAQSDVDELAAAASVPVINALTDQHHPCQALADLLTLREQFGTLEGIKLAYVGDGDNVAHSLMEAGALTGMEIVIATPLGYEPDSSITSATQACAPRHGGSVAVVVDPREAVAGAKAVYTDVWVSMGEDDERTRRLNDLRGYQVNAELMELAATDAVFMHCLPAHRGQEVTAEVIDGPQSIVFAQAANRLPTEQAVVQTLLETSTAGPVDVDADDMLVGQS